MSWLTIRQRWTTMAIKVGINGYGRIGRNILRALYEGKRTARSRSSPSTISAMPRPTRT